MDHVAIDVGGRESQVCRRSADGQILEEQRWPTRRLKNYLATIPKSVVVLETCAESFKIADEVIELGHEVRVVPATLAPALGVGRRQLKTDRRDARALSEASCRMDLPSVHIPSQEARRRHTVVGMRSVLVSSRTALVNAVHGFLRGQGLGSTLKARSKYVPKGVRRLYELQKLQVPHFVERQLSAIEAISTAIDEADEDLKAIANADANCQRLMTVPGVGPVTSVLFMATVDDVRRFPRPREVGSYVGLTPGERSSSDTVHRLGITKSGAHGLRRLLVQAAWAARVHRKGDPLVEWARQIALRRGTFIATVALARKLSVVMLAMLRDGTTYQPGHRKAVTMAT